MQAEYARIPYAMTTLVRVPDGVADDEAILLSDIFPTGWFGGRLAEIGSGDTVAVFGAAVVGQFATLSAKRQGAGLIVVDGLESRLALARAQNTEVVDFNSEDPVQAIKELTGGIGADRVIDAVGIDAQSPERGPAAQGPADAEFATERQAAAPDANPDGTLWQPGDSPSQTSRWAVSAAAKAGSIGIIGVYPPGFSSYPIGEAMNKNLTVRMGNCNHRRYLPRLLDLVVSGVVRPTDFITQVKTPDTALDAYESFDQRGEGWLKTVLAVA